MAQQGVVLEIDGDEVIVLTPGGEFRRQKARVKMPQVGDEILLQPEIPSSLSLLAAKRGPRIGSRWSWAAAAAALLFLTLNSGLFQFDPGLSTNAIDDKTAASQGEKLQLALEAPTSINEVKPVNYVTVDINPSVELGLNENEKVVLVNFLNSDGEKLLYSKNLIGMTVVEAVSVITQEAVKQGYLASNRSNTVMIAVASNDEKAEAIKGLEKKLKETTEQVLVKDNLSKELVGTLRAPNESRETAKELGISVGRYAVLLEAIDVGLIISAQEMKEKSIASAINQAGGKPTELIVKAHKDDIGSIGEKHKHRVRLEIQALKEQQALQVKNLNQNELINKDNQTNEKVSKEDTSKENPKPEISDPVSKPKNNLSESEIEKASAALDAVERLLKGIIQVEEEEKNTVTNK